MRCIASRVALISAVAALAAARGEAQEKPEGEEPIVRIYRVTDLVLPAPNYPYRGTFLPGMAAGSANQSSGGGMMGGGMMGGMGGGMIGGQGGGMGGMGGGMFQVPDYLAQAGGGGDASSGMPASFPAAGDGAMGIDMVRLVKAITNIVEPSTWDEVGGPGTIEPIGGALAIRQSPAVHFKIQEFLDALKRESGALRMVTVEARWLSLDKEQTARLTATPQGKLPAATGSAIEPAALAALPPETERYAGRITCFNGQTVHIISGRIETVIGGLIPVVGGASGVGYQPVMLAPHLGVLLRITPSALPSGDGMLVDLHSSVTRWEKASKAAHIGTSPTSDTSIDVDRINVTAQQFATSLRVPLDKPVLVGGITFPAAQAEQPAEAPAAAEARPAQMGGRQGLYLVLEIHSAGT